MEKKTLIALGSLLALGVLAMLTLRAPEKGQRTGPKQRPVPNLKGADIAKLEITNEKQEKVELDKLPGDKWQMKAPLDWPAEASSAKQITDAFEKLTFGDLVTESADKKAELGVDDGKAAHIIAKDAGNKVLADLIVGKTVGGFVMVRPAGKNEIWQASGLFPYMLNKEPKLWRDHTIFEFPAADAEKLTVDQGVNKLVLTKVKEEGKDKNAEAKWNVAESTGTAPKTAEALDSQQATQAVQALAALKGGEFVESKKPEEVGLDKPVLTLAVTVGGKDKALLIGKTEGDDTYIKAADQPTIYTMKKYSLEHIAKKPIDYRDKTLFKAKEVDLTEVDIDTQGQQLKLTRSGAKWVSGKGPIDDTKIKPVVNAFDRVQADSYADEKDPAKTGLNKPSGTVTLKLKDKTTVQLKIGAETKDKGAYYVQKTGSPDVYLLKKYVVDRFLKKQADFDKPAKEGMPGMPGMPPGHP